MEIKILLSPMNKTRKYLNAQSSSIEHIIDIVKTICHVNEVYRVFNVFLMQITAVSVCTPTNESFHIQSAKAMQCTLNID